MQPRLLSSDSVKGAFPPGAAPRQTGRFRIVQPVMQGSATAGPCHFERSDLQEPVGRKVAGAWLVPSQLHRQEGS